MDNNFIKFVLQHNQEEKTRIFNELSIDDRRAFLGKLSESEKKTFVSQIRRQAVAD